MTGSKREYCCLGHLPSFSLLTPSLRLAQIPLDRGLGSSVASSNESVVIDNAKNNSQWDKKVDEIHGVITKTYMALPLRSLGGECIGIVEARNKKNNANFDTSDIQISQIFAQQVAGFVLQSKQKALLADRNDAFTKAYEKNFDKTEAISLKETEAAAPWTESDLMSKSGVEFASTALGVKQETAQEVRGSESRRDELRNRP